jgi:carbamoyl-phosphate synthase large subunit
VVIVCSIENLDPMGVHTGDSITVAPAQTLTDREYQRLRDQSIAIIREIGVDTGGSNIQFAINPADGEVVVIEMNPRVSPLLRAGQQGHRLPDRQDRRPPGGGLHPRRDHQRHHRGKTPACFEPTIDYVVTKIPRFAFRKIPGQSGGADHLDEVGGGSDGDRPLLRGIVPEGPAFPGNRPCRLGLRSPRPGNGIPDLEPSLRTPSPDRIFRVRDAMVAGRSDEDIHRISAIDPWFLAKLRGILEVEQRLLRDRTLERLDAEACWS